jgi:DNA-directed RNA polymerase subunit RPC12/RpoP
MSKLMDRQQAREHISMAFHRLLDRLLPAEEDVPLKGGSFIEFEQQADELDRTLTAAFLEARTMLDERAQAEEAGRCPHCSSTRVYLEEKKRQVEVQTTHGVVVMQQQSCRCRNCHRSFSPSAARPGVADGSQAVAPGGAAGGP